MKLTPNGKGRKRQSSFQEIEWLSGSPELLSVLIWLNKGGQPRRGSPAIKGRPLGSPFQPCDQPPCFESALTK